MRSHPSFFDPICKARSPEKIEMKISAMFLLYHCLDDLTLRISAVWLEEFDTSASRLCDVQRLDCALQVIKLI